MKKIIYIIFFLFSFKGITQNTYSTAVTYKVKFNFDLPYTYNAKLIFNNSTSYYSEEKPNVINKQEGVKTIKYENKSTNIFNTNLKTNLIFLKTNLDNRTYLQKEKITKIPWKIASTSKGTILGYACKKATGLFRGRMYTAWFTKEIPAKFGPWKLNGLPGLILEVKDALNEVEFTVEKIENVKEAKEFNFDFPKKINDYPIISLKEYNKKINDDLVNKTKKIMAKMPRGSSPSNLKIKEYRGLELKYEWEK